MLKVQASVAPAGTKGLGLFASNFIPAGTTVWELVPGFDVIMTPAQWQEIPEWQRTELEEHAWLDKHLGLWIYATGPGMYFNHSDNPNCGGPFPLKDVALRDILPGEELLINYGDFDSTPQQFVGSSV